MSTTVTLSPSMQKAAKEAVTHVYDKSKYAIIDTGVRRDAKTGRLVSKGNDGKKK